MNTLIIIEAVLIIKGETTVQLRISAVLLRKAGRWDVPYAVPYKHYNEETISGVLDDIVNPDDEDSEIYPSEKTMLRWHHWFILNQFNIEGHMKSIGYRLLGFKEELLKFSNSLLGHIKSSMPDAWLRTILRYLYNSGNSLQPCYS